MFDAIYDAQVRIVGSVLGTDPVISVNNLAATVVIRYDPAVLGTPGLKVPDGSPVVCVGGAAVGKSVITITLITITL